MNLLKEGAIWAEEAVWAEPVSLLDADVKDLNFDFGVKFFFLLLFHLAPGLNVTVIATVDFTSTVKVCFWN